MTFPYPKERTPVWAVKPGSIVHFGIDDDMTCFVLANYEAEHPVTNVKKSEIVMHKARRLVYYGCFCDGTDSYEFGRLMIHDYMLKDTIAVLHTP